MIEEWKPISGYTGLYEISSLGRVKSLPKIAHGALYKEKILKIQTLPKYKYCYINLHNNKNIERFYVHELVAREFIGPRPANYQIDHIDNNKTNNAASNLRYLTRQENMDRVTTCPNQTVAVNRANVKLLREQGLTISAISEKLKLNRGTVWRACRVQGI
jgi:hypothetical protein